MPNYRHNNRLRPGMFINKQNSIISIKPKYSSEQISVEHPVYGQHNNIILYLFYILYGIYTGVADNEFHLFLYFIRHVFVFFRYQWADDKINHKTVRREQYYNNDHGTTIK